MAHLMISGKQRLRKEPGSRHSSEAHPSVLLPLFRLHFLKFLALHSIMIVGPSFLTHASVGAFLKIFLWDWGLNSGFCVCKAVTVLLEPHLQSILLWLFWRLGVSGTICLGWPQAEILLISASLG
jgi:hypothetical protein